jgi:WD40 repeat protein
MAGYSLRAIACGIRMMTGSLSTFLIGAGLFVSLALRVGVRHIKATEESRSEAVGKDDRRVDPSEDPLPPGALARLGSTRFRASSAISSLFFIPGNRMLATVDWKSGIDVWDIRTRRKIRRLSGPHFNAVFSADGQLLASLDKGQATLSILDFGTGRELCRIAGPHGNIQCLQFSPDGKHLASGNSQNSIRIWGVDGGHEEQRLAGHLEEVRALAWSPDGRTLASCDRKDLLFWEAATGKLVRRLDGKGNASKLAWSRDSVLLAVAGEGVIHLWHPATGNEVKTLGTGTASKIRNQNKRMAMGKAASGEDGYLGSITGLAFSQDGKVLYSASQDYREIFRWDIASGRELGRLATDQRVFGLALSADGTMLAAGGDLQRVDLWDAATQTRIHSPAGLQGRVFAVAYSPDGRLLASGGDDQFIRLWQVGTWRECHRFAKPAGSPSGQGYLWRLCFSPDSKLLVISGPGQSVTIHDLSAKKDVYKFVEPMQGGPPNALAFSGDGKLLAASFDGTTVWEISTGQELRRLTAADGSRMYSASVAFAPKGPTLAVGGMGSVRLCDVHTGKGLRVFEKLAENTTLPGGEKYPNTLTGVAFLPDGRSLLSCGYDQKLYQWETSTGRIRCSFAGHERPIHGIALSPDGRTVVSAAGSMWDSQDNSVRLWNVLAGQELGRLSAHQNVVCSVAFAPDGDSFASASEDGMVYVWDATPYRRREKPATTNVTSADMDTYWTQLQKYDAEAAYFAMRRLIQVPRHAVPFLASHLQPVEPVDARRLARWIMDLDDARFSVRSNAERQLEGLGELAQPALNAALKQGPSPEARRRIETLVHKLDGSPSGNRLRELRAVEVLEYIGGTGAKEVLERLAKGNADPRLKQEAKASLERLAKQSAAPGK